MKKGREKEQLAYYEGLAKKGREANAAHQFLQQDLVFHVTSSIVGTSTNYQNREFQMARSRVSTPTFATTLNFSVQHFRDQIPKYSHTFAFNHYVSYFFVISRRLAFKNVFSHKIWQHFAIFSLKFVEFVVFRIDITGRFTHVGCI